MIRTNRSGSLRQNDSCDNSQDIDALHNHEQIIPAKQAIGEKDCAGNKPAPQPEPIEEGETSQLGGLLPVASGAASLLSENGSEIALTTELLLLAV